MPSVKTTKKTSKTTRKTARAPKKSTTRKSTTRKKVKARVDKVIMETQPEESAAIVGKTSAEVPQLPIEPDYTVDKPIERITTNISGIGDTRGEDQVDDIPPAMPSGVFDINRKVLARIAALAASEVEGLIPPRQDPLFRIFDSIKGRTEGIRVDVGTTETAIDMMIRVQYGSDIPKLTDRLRESVTTRIQEMTGLKVVEINIRIQDVRPA